MLIFLLMLTFTLLPYLTGQLMDALTSTSVYQRKRCVLLNHVNDAYALWA
jgi:hypothetical protein